MTSGVAADTPVPTAGFLLGGGEMGARLRGHDWANSPLGDPSEWPQSLRSALSICLNSSFPTAIYWGPELRLLYNDAWSSVPGERHPWALGRAAREVWADIWTIIEPQLGRVVETGEGLSTFDQMLPMMRNGQVHETYWNYSFTPIRGEDGRVSGVLNQGHETTDRVFGERRRTAEAERQRRLFDQAPGFMTVLNGPEHRFEFVNDAYARLFGNRDYIGRTAREVFPDLIGQDFFGLLDQVYRTSERFVAHRVPVDLKPTPEAAAERRILDFIYAPVTDEHGQVTGIFCEGHDVTEAHVAQERLRESEARYRTLFEAIEAGFCLMEALPATDGTIADFRIIEVNPSFAAQAGFEHALGRTLRELLPAEDEHWIAHYAAVIDGHAPLRIEFGSDWLGRWWDIHAFPVGRPEEKRLAVLFTDITERHLGERELRDLNETLERRVDQALAERKILADLVEGTDAYVQVVAPDFRLLAINKAAADEYERVFGIRPRAGDRLWDVPIRDTYHAAVVRALWQRALSGEEFTYVAEAGDGPDKRHYELKFNVLRDSAGQQIGAFEFAYDITERIREQERLAAAEEQLRQSQKMEAMGQLTGGVAHDFNNLLTPIIGTLDALQRRGGSEREQRLIDGALQSAERAKTLVQRLLAFARRQPLQPVAVDVGTLLRGMADLIARTIGPQIKVAVDIADALPPARADVNQVEMAVLNLSVNARDAMPSGGTLRISANPDVLPSSNAIGLPAGGYVRISVADTGIGMDEATLARAFEPFFSTKGIGKGTGLGLSMVHGLAQQLGGALTIESHVGVGTNVELWLPQSDAHAERHERSAQPASAAAIRGMAFLVDDDDVVRVTTADMLSELGYAVTDFADARAALAAITTGPKPDILITDHLMPGMSGTELVRSARALHPELPALIISGYAELEGIEPDLARLTKPFRSAELAASLRAITGSFADAIPSPRT